MFAIFTIQAQNGAEQLKADIQNRVGNYPAVLRLARHNDCKNDKIFAQLKIFRSIFKCVALNINTTSYSHSNLN